MGSGLGEFWDGWIEEDKAEKEELEHMVSDKVKVALQTRYNFRLDGEEFTAVRELEKLAVNRYRTIDYSWQDCFSKVYKSVEHEIALFEEDEESPLNMQSAEGARAWLERWKHLYKVY